MADKTIGDLPAASAIYDDDLFLLEQSGEAKNLRGALYKAYLQGFVDAASAASSEAAAALAGVRDAINNIPEGVATPIVNDLTTGGTSMALSAEMGKVLKAEVDGLTPGDIGAVPLDGSKAMTGALKMQTAAAYVSLQNPNSAGETWIGEGANGTVIANRNLKDDSKNYRAFQVFNSNGMESIANALCLQDRVNGANTYYYLLHTGNKPSGSYTGNGSATERTIATGGVGNFAVIYGTDGQIALVTPFGSIFRSGNIVTVTTALSFYNGDITTKSAVDCNANGATYTYQVL